MIERKADRVVMAKLNSGRWKVYAQDGIFEHHRKIYKTYFHACEQAIKLSHYYQKEVVTL